MEELDIVNAQKVEQAEHLIEQARVILCDVSRDTAQEAKRLAPIAAALKKMRAFKAFDEKSIDQFKENNPHLLK